MRKIILSQGGTHLQELELKPGAMTIGRGNDNDVTLDDAYVSTHHAKLTTFFDSTYVQDVGSTNGTFVNGKKIQMHTVHPGDVITIGRHQLIVQAQDQGAPSDEPPTGRAQHTTVIDRQALDEALQANPQSAGADSNVPGAGPAQGTPAPCMQIIAGANTGARIPVNAETVALGGSVVVQRQGDHYNLARSPQAGETARVVLHNGQRVTTEPVPLKDMDVVQIDGTWLTFFQG